jgi:hypothetical protein
MHWLRSRSYQLPVKDGIGFEKDVAGMGKQQEGSQHQGIGNQQQQSITTAGHAFTATIWPKGPAGAATT